jgi:hypothetical protein
VSDERPDPCREPGGGDAESLRLEEDARRERNWKRWGPYLAERQWGTVREDYSAGGDVWDYFPHDHARSRVYRWGEDGLLGLCDREGRLCFAVALWNRRDPILKERLFGLTGRQGNHGEDVKECYFYLDSTPTHSYMKALYRYPQAEFPYGRLVEENALRSREQREFELLDAGVLDGDRFFDVTAEYAKASPDDILVRLTVENCGPETASIDVLPTLWFRNTWAWGRSGDGYWPRPEIRRDDGGGVVAKHASLGRFVLAAAPHGDGGPDWLFTGNETDFQRVFGVSAATPYVKDAFHAYVVGGRREAVDPAERGTKTAALYHLDLPAGDRAVLRLRLTAAAEAVAEPFGDGFEATFAARLAEADAFYAARTCATLNEEERRVVRQAYAGLLWSKQFYHYVVKDWLEGDPTQPPPPHVRLSGRNHDWPHLFNRDVILMPDGWEYPWYAAWDLAFHVIVAAAVDPALAKEQLILLLREWYMHPSGQLPAYEFAFGDVNPPVHAWACWRVYKMTGSRGERDRLFLERCFHKLLLNFTWWVNRKDPEDNNLFAGGFLGLDNVGVFDRSQPLPTGGHLEQADGTAWMAFFCLTMLAIALELASEDPAYEDVASKFFEHFVAIADAMNSLGGTGLWDEDDGFYYDRLAVDGSHVPLKVRSIVGLLPLLAVEVLHDEELQRMPGFYKRMRWFLDNRPDLAGPISYMHAHNDPRDSHRLLAIPSRARLERVLTCMLDESEFLSPYGIRSLSRFHRDHPYDFRVGGQDFRVAYSPGESDTGLFGGNSNWRGPVWFPLNYLLIEALERYDHFFGETFTVECPTGSGRVMSLRQVALDLAARLAGLFLPDRYGLRPCHGGDRRWAGDPHWCDLLLFNEYFGGDDGRGCGASHQTGWTALVVRLLDDLARARSTP